MILHFWKSQSPPRHLCQSPKIEKPHQINLLILYCQQHGQNTRITQNYYHKYFDTTNYIKG